MEAFWIFLGEGGFCVCLSNRIVQWFVGFAKFLGRGLELSGVEEKLRNISSFIETQKIQQFKCQFEKILSDPVGQS